MEWKMSDMMEHEEKNTEQRISDPFSWDGHETEAMLACRKQETGQQKTGCSCEGESRGKTRSILQSKGSRTEKRRL